MKKIFSLLLLGIIFTPILITNAAVDVDYMTSETYLRNNGYSPEIVRLVNEKKKDPYTPEMPRYKGFAGFFKRIGDFIAGCYYYIDPSADNGKFGSRSKISPGLDGPSDL